jgi:hypothetical protein
MLRRMMIDMIRRDPTYNKGDYAAQPPNFQLASTFFSMAFGGGSRALYAEAPTRAKADALVDKALKASPPADTNDFIYQWQSSADYDVSPNLGRIKARVLAINSADDERNPVASGLMASSIKQIKRARLYLIPASADTRGHGTTGSLAQLGHRNSPNSWQGCPNTSRISPSGQTGQTGRIGFGRLACPFEPHRGSPGKITPAQTVTVARIEGLPEAMGHDAGRRGLAQPFGRLDKTVMGQTIGNHPVDDDP